MGANVDIHSVRPDGRDAQRLTTEVVRRMPVVVARWDRDRVLLRRDRPLRIWTMRANGTGKHRETNLGSSATFPDLAPDGRRIVFSDCARTCRLMVVDRATGKERVVVDDPAADETEPCGRRAVGRSRVPAHAEGRDAADLPRERERFARAAADEGCAPQGPVRPRLEAGAACCYGARGDIWTVDLRGRTRRLTTTDTLEYACGLGARRRIDRVPP